MAEDLHRLMHPRRTEHGGPPGENSRNAVAPPVFPWPGPLRGGSWMPGHDDRHGRPHRVLGELLVWRDQFVTLGGLPPTRTGGDFLLHRRDPAISSPRRCSASSPISPEARRTVTWAPARGDGSSPGRSHRVTATWLTLPASDRHVLQRGQRHRQRHWGTSLILVTAGSWRILGCADSWRARSLLIGVRACRPPSSIRDLLPRVWALWR